MRDHATDVDLPSKLRAPSGKGGSSTRLAEIMVNHAERARSSNRGSVSRRLPFPSPSRPAVQGRTIPCEDRWDVHALVRAAREFQVQDGDIRNLTVR